MLRYPFALEHTPGKLNAADGLPRRQGSARTRLRI